MGEGPRLPSSQNGELGESEQKLLGSHIFELHRRLRVYPCSSQGDDFASAKARMLYAAAYNQDSCRCRGGRHGGLRGGCGAVL